MKPKPPQFSFVLPESFDPAEFLKSPQLQRRHDDARYFVSTVLTKFARKQVDESGLVRLNATALKDIMHQTDYSSVIKSLLDGGAVERFPYAAGVKSFGFRLGARYVSDKHVRVPVTDARLIRRLAKFHSGQDFGCRDRMKPVHLALAKQQERLRIDSAAARVTLNSLPLKSNPFDSQGVLVSAIEHGEFTCGVGQYGRLFNSITSLKRELRSHLSVDGLALGHVDLTCAQPALLAGMMQRDFDDWGSNDLTRLEGKRDGISTAPFLLTEEAELESPAVPQEYDSSFGGDFLLFRSLAQSGELYAAIERGVNRPEIGRDEIKVGLLRDVLAKKGAYRSHIEDAFERLFPSVIAYVRAINGDDHATLIRDLQREESSLVIETVASDLLERHPGTFFLTLHDAIYATHGHLATVEDAFGRAFEARRFSMQFKTKLQEAC